jgi:excisionase family DNA binding protein
MCVFAPNASARMSDTNQNRQETPANAGTNDEAPVPRPAAPSAAPGVGVQPLLWDLAECAVALGVSTRTVKRMAATGELPGVVRLGRCRRFDRRRIERWIADGCPPVGRTGRGEQHSGRRS